MNRSSDNPWLDRLARALFFPYFALLHSVRWQGVENVPRTGAAILAANHQSWYDPVVIALAVHRRVTYLGWDYYCNMPVLGTLMRLAGSIPVDTDSPEPSSIAKMLRLLEQGRLCGIFPEGGRTLDGLIGEPKPGAAALALRTGAPLIPVTISGAHRGWGRGQFHPVPTHISLYFGRPLHVDRICGGREGTLQERRRRVTYELALKIVEGFTQLGRPDLTDACREKLLALYRHGGGRRL